VKLLEGDGTRQRLERGLPQGQAVRPDALDDASHDRVELRTCRVAACIAWQSLEDNHNQMRSFVVTIAGLALLGCRRSVGRPAHGRPASANLVIPPVGVIVLKPERRLPPLIENTNISA
jgi:hypothetical protein